MTAHVPGQLNLSDDERDQLAARMDMLERTRDDLAGKLAAHTLRVVADVAAATERHARTGRELDDAVRLARAAGATWEQIGAAAGMTRQSAHARWAAL